MSTDNIKDHGLVVRWNRTYGFIRPDGAVDKDVYCNIRHVRDRELVPGARVSYHLSPDARYPERVMAVDVEILR
jgi:cold shock CspA family protein